MKPLIFKNFGLQTFVKTQSQYWFVVLLHSFHLCEYSQKNEKKKLFIHTVDRFVIRIDY